MHKKHSGHRLSLLCVVLTVVLINCVGPIYSNKDEQIDVAEPVVYMLPSGYYGKFICLEKVTDIDNKQTSVIKEIPFNEWEFYDNEVNKVFRGLLRKRNLTMELLAEIHPGFGKMIKADSLDNSHIQYLSLKKVYHDDSNEELLNMNPGILIVFTSFELKRSFPNIYAHAKYYVYGIPGGELIYVNSLEKKYMMTRILEKTVYDVFEKGTEESAARFYGLWFDEMDAYIEICSLFSEDIIAAICKQCIK